MSASLFSIQRGTGEPLVLVHGWGMNADVWGVFADRLCTSFRLTIIELPGHGRSAWSGDGALTGWAEACLEVAPDKAIWLGWSLGGLISLQAALLASKRITQLFMLASTPRFVQSDDWPTAMPAAVFDDFADRMKTDPRGTLQRFLALQVRGAASAGNTLRQLKTAFAQWPATQPDALEAGLRLLKETDLRPLLAKLVCPVNWLLGGKDTLAPGGLKNHLTQLRPDMPVRRIEKAAHAPFLSHPDEVFDWVMEMKVAA